MLNIEPNQADLHQTKSTSNDSQQEQDNGNPVWEELSPLVWRDSIYSEEVKDSIMGKLFTEEVKLFKNTLE